MLFAGREVRIGKNCARGLEYGPRPHYWANQIQGFGIPDHLDASEKDKTDIPYLFYSTCITKYTFSWSKFHFLVSFIGISAESLIRLI